MLCHLHFFLPVFSQILAAFATYNFHFYLFSSVMMPEALLASPHFSTTFCLASQLPPEPHHMPDVGKGAEKKSILWKHDEERFPREYRPQSTVDSDRRQEKTSQKLSRVLKLQNSTHRYAPNYKRITHSLFNR